MQSVDVMVGQWARDDESELRSDFVASALPDVQHQRAFVNLLKLLAGDGVPLDDLRPPLEILAERWEPGADMHVLADDVRRALRGRLRGQRSSHITVPEELEAEISSAIPGDDPWPADEELAEIRDKLRRLHPNGHDVALVVSPDLRSVVRRLVDLDSPGLPVLSTEELIPTSPERSSRLVSRFRS